LNGYHDNGIYYDIFLWSGIYHDIYLTTGIYVKYSLANSLDLRYKSGTHMYIIKWYYITFFKYLFSIRVNWSLPKASQMLIRPNLHILIIDKVSILSNSNLVYHLCAEETLDDTPYWFDATYFVCEGHLIVKYLQGQFLEIKTFF